MVQLLAGEDPPEQPNTTCLGRAACGARGGEAAHRPPAPPSASPARHRRAAPWRQGVAAGCAGEYGSHAAPRAEIERQEHLRANSEVDPVVGLVRQVVDETPPPPKRAHQTAHPPIELVGLVRNPPEARVVSLTR